MTASRKQLLAPTLTTVVIAGALVAAGSGTPQATLGPAAAQAPPNIVVIETDDQALESLRVMDNVNSLLGEQGATFQNSFVNYSQCCPSRATFLTGQYMHNHRVFGNTAPNGGFDRFQTRYGNNHLAVWLRGAGYYTAMIGKYLNGYANKPPVPPGWSEWRAAFPDEQMVYGYVLNENGAWINYGEGPGSFKQDVLTGKAVNFVVRRAPNAQPFFLWLTYTAPHSGGPDPSPQPPANCQGSAKPASRHAHAFDSEPLPRPPSFNEADVSDKPTAIQNRPLLGPGRIADIQRKYRCRLASLLSVDEGVRKIIAALSGKGELQDTLLVFTSDNGYFHGEHRIPEEKRYIYEESIRVPLLMRGPGIPRGVNVNDLVINADLAPTIIDVANASPGLVMDGRSLIPVAQQPGIEQGRELLIEGPSLFGEPSFDAIRTERYVYAEHGTGEKELYDLNSDPFELRSRHNTPAYESVQALLAARLHQLRSCAGSSCRAHP